MTFSPSVSIVVVAYNSADYIVSCLESIKEAAVPAQEVIVVDNASQDGSAELAENLAEVIRVKDNAGFARGCNIGAKRASCDVLLFLNPDCRLDRGAVAAIQDALRSHPDVGVCGSRVLHPDWSLQDAGSQMDRTGHPAGITSLHEESRPFFVSGCALAVRRDAFEEAGGFDESYFMFVEDLDLCWRLQLMGWRIMVEPSAVVYHEGGASLAGGYERKDGAFSTNSRRIYLRERNTLRSVLKNYAPVRAALVATLRMAAGAAEAAIFLSRGRPGAARAYADALKWNLVNLRSTLETRSQVQRTRMIKDRDLAGIAGGYAKWAAWRRIGLPRLEEVRPGGRTGAREPSGAGPSA